MDAPKRVASYPSDCLSVQGFRGSFIPLPGYFSPFPHGTGSLSVARSIRALEGGPPSFPQDFACPVVLRVVLPSARCRVSATGLSPAPVGLPRPFAYAQPPHGVPIRKRRLNTPYNPSAHCPFRQRAWFGRQPGSLATTTGLSTQRCPHHLGGHLPCERQLLILLPRGTEMFQFPRYPPAVLPRWSR